MRVGIIGGGISGLAAGRGLVENHDVVVFDTGKRRVGGRCASRLPFETGWGGAVDHAAQFVKVSTPRFAAHVEEAVSRGVLRPYGAGSYVGTAELGISGFATDLASGLDVRGDAWIPPNGGLRGGWLVDGEPFDAVVIAHNGKCAERLGKRTSLGPLLRARFGRVDSKRLSLNSVYSLLFEVPAGTVDVDVRYVEDEVLAFLSNNNLKLGWEARYHVFTALSTGDFARRNKHPQEALQGTETETRVVEEMLRAVERACGVAVRPTTTRLQLWGAALPLNAWSSDADFVWDAQSRIGIVGDWLHRQRATHNTSSIEAAFISGDALAAHLNQSPHLPRGLDGAFQTGSVDLD